MQLIYQTNNLFDAHLVKHALEAADIPAFVFGESLLGAGGELPLFGMLRVCVPDSAKAEAEDIVAALGLDEGADAPILDDDDAPGFLPA
ncbi:DUF2007 domain-containing protein [Stenotrophomonas terrae]|uniref:putative signal transducing protein n=1 Tax=Stenotrophomonas terrae TaxID=405446 RepID=UPI003209A889